MGGVSMEWKEVIATDYCYKVADGTHDSPKKQSKGRFLITSKHIKGHSIDFDNAYYISEYDYQKIIKRSKIDKWDVIVSMIGEYCGFCYLEDSNFTEYAVKNVGILKVGERIKSLWLYYYLNSPAGRNQLKNTRAGSSQPYISLGALRNLLIPEPPREDMERIVTILSSLDRKIELNNKINADLEEMAQAIFKNWFVDFEPFKDGKFVNSELGMIPEGWKVGTLKDITINKSVKVKDRADVKVLSPVTTGELVLSEDYFSKQVFSSSIAKYKIVNIGDFAYNPARVNIGSLGRNEFEFDGCVSPVYVVFSVIDGYENYFDLFRKTDFFKDMVASLAIGGVRQSLSYDDLSSIETIIPKINIVEKFNNLYNQMKKTIKANKQESSHLSLLRDTLLPRLMSGEIEVPE